MSGEGEFADASASAMGGSAGSASAGGARSGKAGGGSAAGGPSFFDHLLVFAQNLFNPDKIGDNYIALLGLVCIMISVFLLVAKQGAAPPARKRSAASSTGSMKRSSSGSPMRAAPKSKGKKSKKFD